MSKAWTYTWKQLGSLKTWYSVDVPKQLSFLLLLAKLNNLLKEVLHGGHVAWQEQ